jgi:RNA polymerase subunit RPABC4/transcription elongation factor Spt4
MSDHKKECPGCAVPIDSAEEICPICGYEFPKQSTGIKIMAWLMIILMIWWLVF